MKKNVSFIVVAFIVLLSSCSKYLLDLSSDKYYNIKTFLKSENCDADCGTEASCEGKTVKLQGVIDVDNINKESNYFRIVDKNDIDFNIQIDVNQSINLQVFDKVAAFGSKLISVEGVANGFDAPTNYTCERLFNLTVNNPENLKLN